MDLSDDEGMDNATDDSDEDACAEDVEFTPCSMGARASWDDLPLDDLRRLRIHKFSGVAHIASNRDPHRFICGRRNTKNFGLIQEGSNFADMPICMQCHR